MLIIKSAVKKIKANLLLLKKMIEKSKPLKLQQKPLPVHQSDRGFVHIDGAIKNVKAVPLEHEKHIDKGTVTPNPKGGKATCT